MMLKIPNNLYQLESKRLEELISGLEKEEKAKARNTLWSAFIADLQNISSGNTDECLEAQQLCKNLHSLKGLLLNFGFEKAPHYFEEVHSLINKGLSNEISVEEHALSINAHINQFIEIARKHIV